MPGASETSGKAVALRRAFEAIRHLSDPEPPWHDILQSARDVVGSDTASFLVVEGTRLVDGLTLDVDAVAEREYFAHFHTKDILLNPSLPWTAGSWFDTEWCLTPEVRSHSEYYNDFMLKHRMRHMMSFQIETGPQSSAISFHRARKTEGADDFLSTGPVKELTSALLSAMADRKAAADRVLTAIDLVDGSFNDATFLVDAEGRVIHACEAARVQLDAVSAVGVRGGRLWHASARLRKQLETSLRRASLASGPLRIVLPGRRAGACVMDLARADGRLRYDRRPLLLARVSPPRARAEITLDVLCAALDITTAEGEVLAELMHGATAEEIAAATAISIHTVRKHIAHLMEKTGCARQVDLVRLALGAVGCG
ncbi:LuxR C-terminal-related transcriptional regulator [Variovorax sp. J2P1-59]|uniref:helix-turn-helix transcriptional regulator n=1 Tax=Variovorax flavidus TaxID=3053501 RepID=UPI002575E864|nr:LuxR C-terminal-related transcriptional regulator [Variovorax sp. J2P1-59]MDM0073941.1 LuxR C-terminal-related transcriptional regulator [Variovorax sp. J2P1-59]